MKELTVLVFCFVGAQVPRYALSQFFPRAARSRRFGVKRKMSARRVEKRNGEKHGEGVLNDDETDGDDDVMTTMIRR